MPLESPGLLTDSAQTGIRLVADGDCSEALEVLSDSLQEARSGDVDSSLGLQWLINQRSGLVSRGGIDNILDLTKGLFGIGIG